MTERLFLPAPHYLLLVLLLGLGLGVPSSAFAQDGDPEGDPEGEDDADDPEDEDEDEDEDTEDPGREGDNVGVGVDLDKEEESVRARRQREAQEARKKQPVREVVKGPYLKVNLGPIFWLGDIRTPPNGAPGTNSSGTQMDISFGYDIIDSLNFTLSVDGSFVTMVTNGTGISIQDGALSPIQGDFRVFGGIGSARFAVNLGGKRVKRLSIAGHAGGGIAYSPPLIDLQSARIIQRMAWPSLLQDQTLGLVQAGVGLEYYTRLSHFSLGLDVDFNLMIPPGGSPVIAMGLATNVFVKYTF